MVMSSNAEDQGQANLDQYRRHYRFSSAEYKAVIEAGILGKYHRAELIDGQVLELEPYTYEQDMVANRAMLHFFDVDPVKYTGIVKATLYVDEGFVPDPDYWLARMDDLTLSPEKDDILLILEAAEDSLQFDLEVKSVLYSKAGVEELWVVDLPSRTLHRFTYPAPEEYKERQVLTENEQVTPRKMPGKSPYVRELLR